MRVPITLLVLLLAFSSSGCLLHEATDVLVSRTYGSLEDCVEQKRNWKWAESVWDEVNGSSGETYSKDYVLGFKSGFAEFLYKGGSGEPPYLPPPRYQKLRYRTPEGYAAAEDWFRGYRYGASVARDGDYRRWVLGPTSTPVCDSNPAPVLPQVAPMPRAVDEPIMVVPIKVRPTRQALRAPEPEQVQRTGWSHVESRVPPDRTPCDAVTSARRRACEIISAGLLDEAGPEEEQTPKESR